LFSGHSVDSKLRGRDPRDARDPELSFWSNTDGASKACLFDRLLTNPASLYVFDDLIEAGLSSKRPTCSTVNFEHNCSSQLLPRLTQLRPFTAHVSPAMNPVRMRSCETDLLALIAIETFATKSEAWGTGDL
jgi:hypothetical protein